METYTLNISGRSMETERRFMTGNVLRRYLLEMVDMHNAQVPKHPNLEYQPQTTKSGGRIFSGDNIVDLVKHNDFVLQPVQIR